jgi:hypothetical protein
MKINQHALKYIFTETLFRQQEGSLQNTETDIKFLGKNNKNILIIAPNHEDVMNNSNQSFLIKILNSIGLQLEDVIIINPKKEAKFSFYDTSFSPSKIILFGVKPFEIDIKNVDIPTYEIKDFENKPVLYIDDLKTIQGDLPKKKALWMNLKQLF